MATAAVNTDVERRGPVQQGARECARRDRHVFVVCTGEQCAEAGGLRLLSDLEQECRHAIGDVRVGASRCMGHCQLAPAMMGDGQMMGWVSRRRLKSELCRLGVR